jgi:hypothetical protein
MAFDIRSLKNTDFKITPDKIKLGTSEETSVTVTLATKKLKMVPSTNLIF